MVKLAELILQRTQLQDDLRDQAARMQANAAVYEGEAPEENPEDILPEYWATYEKLEPMQRRIQDVNARAFFDNEGSSMMMSHALVRREALRKQVSTLQSIVDSATASTVRYSVKEERRVPSVNLSSLRGKIKELKKESQQMDVQIQKRNWAIDVP